MGQLDNQVAIVTGAGSGIGRAIALTYAREGAKVTVADIVPERIQDVVAEIEKSGGIAKGIPTDVTNESQVQNMVDATIAAFGALDIVVNNVGMTECYVSAEEVTDTLWETIFDVNAKAPMRVTRKVLSIFTTQKSGVIINIASTCGLLGSRAGAAYTASKHALIGFTKNVGFQYADYGIRCNAIAPGQIESEIGESLYPADSFGAERVMMGDKLKPRIGTPEEIAGVALFLASKDASFINATTITADAGWTAY